MPHESNRRSAPMQADADAARHFSECEDDHRSKAKPNGAHYADAPEHEAHDTRTHSARGEPVALFPVLTIDEIEIEAEPVWAVDGLLPAAGIGVVFGLPKSGKSFLLADTLFHIAMGRPWAGRDVLPGAVAYVSREGVRGLKRRFVAMRRHYGVEGEGIPFSFIPAIPKLGTAAGDADKLIATLQAWLKSIGNPPLRAIAIDTLARAMTGANENATEDMGVLVDNAERVAEALNCIVILVHHAGRTAADRSRGSNALDGAADVMWQVEKGDAQNKATIAAMKDGEDGISWTFRLAPYNLEEVQPAHATATLFSGGATSSCVVEINALPQPVRESARARNKKPLPPGPKLLLDTVKYAISETGERLKGDLNVPHDVLSISRDMLKRYAKIRGYFEDGKADNANRSMLSRDLKRLRTDELIGLTEHHLWLLAEGAR